VALVLTVGAALALGGCGGGAGAAAPPPAPPVSVAVAEAAQKPVPVEVRTFGAVEPNLTAAIKAQIGGLLTEVHFTEGRMVKKGDPLFTIRGGPAGGRGQPDPRHRPV
jgi:multidrug efflux pump subunit AcrA (membrane-fusion protein)